MFEFEIAPTKVRYVKVDGIKSHAAASTGYKGPKGEPWHYAYVAEIEAFEVAGEREVRDPVREFRYEYGADGRVSKATESDAPGGVSGAASAGGSHAAGVAVKEYRYV